MGSAETGTEQDFSLLLDDQLCFALYAASRAVTNRYRPLLEEFGLTYPQYLVLLVLWEHDTVPIKDIGAALQLDYGTLTPLIKRLESAGLVRRERRPDDERTVLVTLTDQGAQLRERARTIPKAIGDAMGLTPTQFDQARGLLRLLATNVSESGRGGA
ncbi:MarR family winged helix-turn-helix transcriptional regulator [Streptomyces griseorubiginosus]|uniref:MarR family winged helix-turn-helix transcriptional regulator n=1 Tax=Streptomyces griseorubiginosus TaxID=67304 RepID=UPI002E809587|nr:MarR family transcriptional regulator [Streptomyces griseorubiginosus]WUB49218.1 MarR family transcriptional regulator [Streptomyces griseorubiginosus]WUB57746.1 MarR family transcriptional regulator [Streptomyces griseorubiginosus]